MLMFVIFYDQNKKGEMNVSEEQFRWSEFGNKVKRDEAGWFEWMNTKLLAHENDHKGWCGYGGMELYNH